MALYDIAKLLSENTYPGRGIIIGKSADGKNAMAKHVISADEKILAEDEVFVVDESDNLIATGMAVLAGCEMLGFNFGTAVKVRQGVNKK